jgi:hypothetical protein
MSGGRPGNRLHTPIRLPDGVITLRPLRHATAAIIMATTGITAGMSIADK